MIERVMTEAQAREAEGRLRSCGLRAAAIRRDFGVDEWKVWIEEFEYFLFHVSDVNDFVAGLSR
jgi:hypothetical protein